MDIPFPHLYSGKVRDIFDAGNDRLLFVTSDRISAFDVVMREPIPQKGRVLTAMTAFWIDHFGDRFPSHLITTDLGEIEGLEPDPDLEGRVMLVRKAEMLAIECIVRGYLTGSAWKEYREHGTMHGVELPEGMLEAQQLPAPVFTPSTKADDGDHDINISFEQACDLVGEDNACAARDLSISLYENGRDRAASRGILIADTKFELGFIDGRLSLCDEVLTPDSSRFWPAEGYEPGRTPPSFDKQPVRDYLDGIDWDKTPPPPPLPDEVVAESSTRYIEAYERITGLDFALWPGVRPS